MIISPENVEKLALEMHLAIQEDLQRPRYRVISELYPPEGLELYEETEELVFATGGHLELEDWV